MADRAYEALRTRILDLHLLPGQVIPELTLAADLGMSRTPIREALGRLRTEGLVEAAPRRGFIVSVPTAEALRETYEIVGALEGHAVRRAARDTPRSLVTALRAAVDAQEAALTTDDPAGWARADQRFHELLRDAAENRRMAELFRQFDGQLHRARLATLHLRAALRPSTEDHRAILAAIEAGDPDAALRVHLAHRERADAEMLHAVRDYAGLILRTLARSDGPRSVEAHAAEGMLGQSSSAQSAAGIQTIASRSASTREHPTS